MAKLTASVEGSMHTVLPYFWSSWLKSPPPHPTSSILLFLGDIFLSVCGRFFFLLSTTNALFRCYIFRCKKKFPLLICILEYIIMDMLANKIDSLKCLSCGGNLSISKELVKCLSCAATYNKKRETIFLDLIIMDMLANKIDSLKCLSCGGNLSISKELVKCLSCAATYNKKRETIFFIRSVAE